jgi:hypothetical protein
MRVEPVPGPAQAPAALRPRQRSVTQGAPEPGTPTPALPRSRGRVSDHPARFGQSAGRATSTRFRPPFLAA